MSNSKTNREQSKKIEQSENQLSPRNARAQDFKVGSPVQTSNAIGHNQRGRSAAEEKKLFAEAAGVKSVAPTPNKSVAGKKPLAKAKRK
jgi:hypothetical protein